MNLPLLGTLFFAQTALSSYSQNIEEFFKVYPTNLNDLPQWVQLIYTAHLNVEDKLM